MTAVKQEEVDTTSDTSGDQLPMKHNKAYE